MHPIGYIPAAFHSFLPEQQQMQKHNDVVGQIKGTQQRDQPRHLDHVNEKQLRKIDHRVDENGVFKFVSENENLRGSALLPGPLNTAHSTLRNTETTSPRANDPKAATRERNRAIAKYVLPGIRMAKAKYREIAYRAQLKFISPNVMHTIEVQDMDDNLTSEQLGTNYRQVHNAVAMAAADHRHVERYPVLKLINETMRAQRENPKEVEGMPWVCKTGKDFEAYGMSQSAIQPKDFRPAFVRNLLDNVHVLNPEIKLDHETKEHVYHLIYNNFNNQYERMIDPTYWSGLNGADDAPKVARVPAKTVQSDDLPFPHSELELMAGAKNYLQKTHPGEFRALISNRKHPHVRKAMEKSGLMPFFKYVTGTPEVSVYRPSNDADAEAFKPTPLDAALQEVMEKKEEDIAAHIAETNDPVFEQKMNDMKGAREADDANMKFRWQQQQHTTVEQIHRKPDQWMTEQAIQVAIAAGYKFSKYVKLVTMGDTGKDGTQIFPTLERGGKLTKEVAIAKTEFTMINPWRDDQFNAAMELARKKGLNVVGKHVSSFDDLT